MTNKDITISLDFLKSRNLDVNNVCVLSPTTELPYYEQIFSNIKTRTEAEWNLNYNNPYSEKFDLIIAHNIFYMSRDPELWLNNVMNSCRYFLLQDLLKRQRSIDSEFCKFDNDNTRFSFNNHKYYDGKTFNLSNIKHKIINGNIYDGEPNEYDNKPKHFVCLIENKV